MQSDCNFYRELLWSYLAKELSDAESKKVEDHLQGCPSCRQEARELALVISSLQEEIPLPVNFTQELHEKLVSVSEEMATEKPSLKEKILDGLKTLPQSRAFRTLAPALACLVLVVGVFSSGLFDKWNSSDEILTHPVSVTEKPSPVSPEHSPVQEKSVTPDPASLPPSSDSAPVTERKSVAEPQPEVISEAPPVVSEPQPAVADSEHLPAPASVENEETPATFTIPRHRPMILCLNVENAETFLNNWQIHSGFDWTSAIQDITPEELIAGADPDALVLKLCRDSFDNLAAYADSQESTPETQGETLIIIAEDEE